MFLQKFEMDELPCLHALAVINVKYLNAYDFCSQYYTMAIMTTTYQGVVYPTGNRGNWQLPGEIANQVALPPIGRKKSSRPEKQRFKAPWENSHKRKYSICGEGRHN